jgi:hypothetical protein
VNGVTELKTNFTALYARELGFVKYQKKVFLMGGMGNKFFQIARALAFKQKNVEVELVFVDSSMLSLYRLTGHTIHGDWLEVSSLANCLAIKMRPIRFFELISLGVKFTARKLGIPIRFDETISEALSKDSNSSNNAWDIGYFQTCDRVTRDSLAQVADALISILAIKENEGSDEMVCHLRGGDFQGSDRLNESAYSAMIDISQSLSLKLVAVTNDQLFCREFFQNYSYKLYEGESAADDFVRLASSSNLYVSNSTFAFWAALISVRSHSAMVYAPENWPYSKTYPLSE